MALSLRPRPPLGWALTLCAACGGSPSPPSPAPTAPSTLSTSAATVTIGAFTINYEADVTSADRGIVEGAVRGGQALFQSRFGRPIAEPTTVSIRAGTGSFGAQAQGHLITIFTGDAGWSAVSPARRHRTVVHEAFHVLQNEAGWADDPNRWLREGAAEYVGYAAAVDAGMTSYATVRDCEIQIYINGGGASTPRLETISFALSSPVGSRYAIA